MPIVAETSGWDVAAAIGTIGGATATLLAVAGALWIGKRDRDAADQAVRAQIEAQAASRRREHEVDLLLDLNRSIAKWVANQGMPQQREAVAVLYGLLHSLPEQTQQNLIAAERLTGSVTWGPDGRAKFVVAYPRIHPEKQPAELAAAAQAEVTRRLREIGSP